MAIISVVDNHGNPITSDKGRINIRVSKGTDDQSVDDRFTDNVGHTSWPGGYVGGEVWTSANLYVNTRNVNTKYSITTLINADLSRDLTITLHEVVEPPPGPVCPDKFDKPAVSNWFFKVANSVGVSINSSSGRDKMKPGLHECGASWQHDSGGNTRARVFMDAFGPNDDSPWAFDTGDEGKPFELTFRY